MQFPHTSALKNLIDCLEDAKHIDEWEVDDPDTQDMLLQVTGWFRSAMYLEHMTETPYTFPDLQKKLEKERLPYKVVEVELEDDPNLKKAYKIEGIKFNDNVYHKYASQDILLRYLRGMANQPITAYKIKKELVSIHTLYNYHYGPFFKDDWRCIYTIDDLNMLFEHHQIPYFFTTLKLVGTNNVIETTYRLREVNW